MELKDVLVKTDSMLTIQETNVRRWWTPFIWSVLLFLLPSVFIGLLAGIVLPFVATPQALPQIVEFFDTPLFLLFSFSLNLLACLIFFRRFEKQPLRAMGFSKEQLGLRYLQGFCIGVGALFLVFLGCVLFGGVTLSWNPEAEGWFVLLLLLGFMIQGLTEEVICRGYLMNMLASRKSVAVGIVGNSLFFSLLHALNPNIHFLSLLNLFLFGLIFSLLFYLTDNIWLVGAAHTSWNFLMGPFLGIEVSGQSFAERESILRTTLSENQSWLNGGSFGLEGGVACTVVACLALGVLVNLARRKSSTQVLGEK